MRPILSKAHVAVGLLSSLPLIVIVLTGLALGLCRILHLSDSGFRLPNPATAPLDQAAAARLVTAHFPPADIVMIRFPEGPRDPLRVRLVAHKRTTLLLDPSTGLELGREEGEGWVETIYQIHRGAILGLAGKCVASGCAAAALGLWLAGLKLRTTAASRAKALHRRTAVWAGTFAVFVMALGGLYNFTGSWADRLDPPPSATAGGPGGPPDFSAAVSAALAAYPNEPLESVRIGQRPHLPLQCIFENGTRVYVEAGGSQVLKVAMWSSHWSRSLFPLHTGRVFGALQPVWVAIAGICALLVLLSGLGLARQRYFV